MCFGCYCRSGISLYETFTTQNCSDVRPEKELDYIFSTHAAIRYLLDGFAISLEIGRTHEGESDYISRLRSGQLGIDKWINDFGHVLIRAAEEVKNNILFVFLNIHIKMLSFFIEGIFIEGYLFYRINLALECAGVRPTFVVTRAVRCRFLFRIVTLITPVLKTDVEPYVAEWLTNLILDCIGNVKLSTSMFDELLKILSHDDVARAFFSLKHQSVNHILRAYADIVVVVWKELQFSSNKSIVDNFNNLELSMATLIQKFVLRTIENHIDTSGNIRRSNSLDEAFKVLYSRGIMSCLSLSLLIERFHPRSDKTHGYLNNAIKYLRSNVSRVLRAIDKNVEVTKLANDIILNFLSAKRISDLGTVDTLNNCIKKE